jgi:hypothetical protein
MNLANLNSSGILQEPQRLRLIPFRPHPTTEDEFELLSF